jgi:hypothetical protein
MSKELSGEEITAILGSYDDLPGSYGQAYAEGAELVVHFNGGLVERFPLDRSRGLSSDADSVMPIRIDDLTVISGVGKGTAGALKAAGLVSFELLREASDEELLEVVNRAVLGKIRAYLEEEHSQ